MTPDQLEYALECAWEDLKEAKARIERLRAVVIASAELTSHNAFVKGTASFELIPPSVISRVKHLDSVLDKLEPGDL